MGRFATDVQTHLRERLATLAPRFDWTTEHRVGRTPVDVAGESAARLVVVELEWRRADPADNTAKLFRHLAEERLDGRVDVFQIFARYYDLAGGGVSSKRANAEFVGRTAATTFDALQYHSVEFALDPPKRGAERPDGWRAVADATASDMLARL